MNNEQNEVQFQESQFSQGMGQPSGQRPVGGLQRKLTGLIIKISGGKLGESQATLVLFGLCGLMLAASFFLIISSFGGGEEIVIPEGEIPGQEEFAQ